MYTWVWGSSTGTHLSVVTFSKKNNSHSSRNCSLQFTPLKIMGPKHCLCSLRESFPSFCSYIFLRLFIDTSEPCWEGVGIHVRFRHEYLFFCFQPFDQIYISFLLSVWHQSIKFCFSSHWSVYMKISDCVLLCNKNTSYQSGWKAPILLLAQLPFIYMSKNKQNLACGQFGSSLADHHFEPGKILR